MRRQLPFITVSAFAALATASCATRAAPNAVEFYASWSGEHEQTRPVFHALDQRLRTEPGFRRGFGDAMNVHLGDGTATSDGALRHTVRMAVSSRYLGRRLSERDRVLARFEVTCDPQAPQACVDRILAQTRRQKARLGRIVARSPEA